MKKLPLYILIICLILGLFSYSTSATVFSINEIRSNQQIQGAELGLELGPLILTGGADAVFLSTNVKSEYYEEGFSDTMELDVNGHLIVPNIGIKLYLSGNQTRPYLKGNIFKPFPSISVEEDGQEMVPDDVQENIEDILGAIGGQLGFGTEYQINEHIGIAGETGIRYFFNSFKDSQEGYNWRMDTELEGILGITYSSLSVNFYF